MTATTSPRLLVASARQLAATTERKYGGSLRLGAVIILRQALEAALDEYWAATEPTLADANMRCQMIALRTYLPDAQLAHDLRFCWSTMSELIHYTAYELPPGIAEINRMAETIDRFITATNYSIRQ